MYSNSNPYSQGSGGGGVPQQSHNPYAADPAAMYNHAQQNAYAPQEAYGGAGAGYGAMPSNANPYAEHSFAPQGGSGVNPYDTQAASYVPREFVFDDPWFQPCTAIAVDTQQELVWTGFEDGRLSSWRFPSMKRYTAFPANFDNTAVLQIIPMAAGILSISQTRIGVHSRGGVFKQPLLQATKENFSDVRCGEMFRNRNLVVATGVQGDQDGAAPRQLHFFDLAYSGLAVQTSPQMESCVNAMTFKKYLYAGCADGHVLIYDTRIGLDSAVQTIFHAQKGKIRDIAIRNNMVVTCGMSEGQPLSYRNQYRVHLVDDDGESPDPDVNVFDTRMIQVQLFRLGHVCCCVRFSFQPPMCTCTVTETASEHALRGQRPSS